MKTRTLSAVRKAADGSPFRPSEVGAIVGVSTKTVKSYIEAGELPAYRVGHRAGVGEWRIRYADARRFILRLTRVA